MTEHAADVPSLVRLGLNSRWEALFAPMAEEGFTLGRVMRADRGLAWVGTGEAIVLAEPAAHLLKSRSGSAGSYGESRFAVGDWVALLVSPEHEKAIIEAILPRSSAFSRKDPSERTTEQVVAANIDYILIVQSLAPNGPNLRRLERELVMAWDSGATPVVVLSKADLVEDPARFRRQVEEIAYGVDVHVVSGLTGEGVEELRGYAIDGATVAMFGASGVGKSTLVNRLVGSEVMRTAEVREYDGKGRHTTVSREMILLPQAGVLIDTPGMRALALWDADSGMSAAFPEIERLAEECRFRDCAHRDEPGCAVVEAAETGVITRERLASYLRLRDEITQTSALRDVAARAERKRQEKVMGRAIKRYLKDHPEKG